MTQLLDHLEVGPAGQVKASIIWLHGLGADGHDFEPVVPMLGLGDEVRFIFPHAPARSVTINAGMVMPAWYDITTLAEAASRESAEDIAVSKTQIEALLRREQERGVPSNRIIMAGFSQGGAMALHVASRWPQQLAGLMILSAYLLMPEELQTEAAAANHSTPALFCHGRYDDVVPMERGRRAFEDIEALNAERAVQWHDFPMGHELCPGEIAVISTWLSERLNGD